MVTEGWVDDEHLLALGRVVVAATWLETVVDHLARWLTDDGPLYDETVAGLPAAKMRDLVLRLARRVILDKTAVEDLEAWMQKVRGVQEERNRLLHAEHLGSEEGHDDRALIISIRAKRRTPPIEISASVGDVLDLAARIDALVDALMELQGRLVAGYVGRDHR